MTTLVEIRTAFRAAVRERLHVRRLRQDEAARALNAMGCDFHPSAISKMVTGNRGIDVAEGILLARLLGIDLNAMRGDVIQMCDVCHDVPPAGFICATCGREGTS